VVGIDISDTERVETWACGFHGDGTFRTDDMCGDRVGVGDIGVVHDDGTWYSGDTTGGDDGRRSGREHDRDILNGPCLPEHYISKEPCGFHGDGTLRPDGM
jgi:hypothetical protein